MSKAGVPGSPAEKAPARAPEAEHRKGDVGLNADVEGKLKVGLPPRFDEKKFSAKIEGDVTTACTKLSEGSRRHGRHDVAPKGDGPGKKAEAVVTPPKFLGELKAATPRSRSRRRSRSARRRSMRWPTAPRTVTRTSSQAAST